MTAENENKDRQLIRLIIYMMLIVTMVFFPMSFGWIQPIEKFFYDSLIRLRPLEPTDERIVIVGLTENDIKTLSEVPVSDLTLAKLIEKIRKYNPQVIGLDLHRNVPTRKGWNRLESIIQSTPQLVGIEKTSQGLFDTPAVPPHPVLKNKGMSSASDLIDDGGDVIRRGYLYVRKSANSEETIPSFGLKVAIEYLKAENIRPEDAHDAEHNLKLGNTIFPRLNHNQHFYSREDLDDYQILINFHSPSNKFRTVSFSEVLNNDISPELFKNKIVLIGIIAPTLGDDFFSPYNRKITDFRNETFGVEIHANQISQIISAALEQRKIIKLLPRTVEFVWLLFWMTTPCIILVNKVNSIVIKPHILINYVLINVSIFILIIFIGFISLIQGYWIPMASPVIALSLNFLLGIYHLDLAKEKQVTLEVKKKLKEKTQELEEIQQQIIAKEKLEAYKKLAIKMAHEIRNYLNSIGMANHNCQHKLAEFEQIVSDNSFLFEEMYESDQESPSSIVKYFEHKLVSIEGNIEKITLIIETILAENLTESKPDLVAIDINQLITDVVDEFSWHKNPEWKPNIVVNLTSDLPDVKISALDLERILINLMTNSCDSLYEKTLNNSEYCPQITLTTSFHPSGIEIKIKDNGLGISHENLKQIFEPFWTTKNSANGVGVGLFFSKQRIEKYHGTLTVESDEGKWTEFTLMLPAN